MRSVHLKVINDALMDYLCLVRRHSPDPVTTGQLATCGNRTVTPDAHPQHLQVAQRLLPSLLRVRPAEEYLIDDDPGT
jgi:hypothetical protein